ncbi:MAG: hypothetical protein HUJ26_07775 [Planctomycetaceae bacterium]|nr:hypothetical protein [Planctomycetaceae bacterium]
MNPNKLFPILAIFMALASQGMADGEILESGDLNIIVDAGNASDGLRFLDMSFSNGLTLEDALTNARATYPNARLATPAEWDDLFAAAGITYHRGLTASDAFAANPVSYLVTGTLNGGVTIEDNDPAVWIVRQALGPSGDSPHDTYIWSAPDGSNDFATTRDVAILSLDDFTAFQSSTPATGSRPGIGWLLVSDPDRDRDDDGLTDDQELAIGTDPEDPDTDDDGLLDGTEVDIADGTACPNPLIADSDGDTLVDGLEVNVLGTSPCLADTDDDGIPDNEDPTPLEPGATTGFFEEALRQLAADILDTDTIFFSGKNHNVASGRRNAMANKATAAANAVAAGDVESALDSLISLLDKLDGNPSPADWMYDSDAKDAAAHEVELLIEWLLI